MLEEQEARLHLLAPGHGESVQQPSSSKAGDCAEQYTSQSPQHIAGAEQTLVRLVYNILAVNASYAATAQWVDCEFRGCS